MAEAEEAQLGAAAYRETLSKARLPRDPAVTAVVHRVGERIARAADKPGYDWQFTVVDDPRQANAFALPGGKVAVYTGLFPVAQDEAGLAVVMGHEVAHALARHGAERMSQAGLLQLGAIGLAAGLGGASPMTRDTIFQAYGLGSQVGILMPFGRSQEAEADRIGLILMAKAGYDPAAAIGLWQRMEKQANGQAPPEFLSTHPSYHTRQRNIESWLPEARGYFQPAEDVRNEPLPQITGVARDD